MDSLLSANARSMLLGPSSVDATYTPAGGATASALRVLAMNRRSVTGNGWSGEYIDIYAHQEDVTPAIGDVFTIAGEAWAYRPEAGVTVELRGCGAFWACPCSKSVRGAV